MDESKLTSPGLRMIPTAALPNVYAAGWAKTDVSNHWATERREKSLGLPKTSGRWPPAEKQLQLFVLVVTVSGAADCTVPIIAIDQPPSTWRRGLVASHGLPAPNGSSNT